MDIDIINYNFPNANIKVTCVYNFKGGVGKTFSTLNLAHKFATDEPDKKQPTDVLLVDLDGQCSLSFALSRKLREIRETVDDLKDTVTANEMRMLQQQMVQLLSNEDKHHIVRFWRNELSPEPEAFTEQKLKERLKTETNNLYLINGSPHIYEVESWMTTRTDSLTDRFKLINMIVKFAEIMKIQNIIIDLNPGNTLLNKSVIARSNRLLVPMFLDEGSVNSVKVLFSWVYPEAAKFNKTQTHAYRDAPRRIRVLFNKYKKMFPKNYDDDDERMMTSTSRFWAGVIRELLSQQFNGDFTELSPNMESQVMKPKNTTHYNVNAGTEQWKVDELNSNLRRLIRFIKRND